MTGPSPSDFNAWASLWGDAQQKYWQSWMDLTHKAANPVPDPAVNPWTQGFELWAKALSGAAPAESRDWMTKLTDINRGYLMLGEHFSKLYAANPGAAATPEGWWNTLRQGLQQMQEQWAAQTTGGKDPWAGFAAFWGLPMDTWRRVASACSVMPGDIEKALRGFGSGEAPLSRLLAMPSIGYTREWQEELQTLQQKWLDHAKAIQAYGEVLRIISTRSTELLGQKLTDTAGGAKPPATIREFYNLWVDCAEEAFAERAYSPNFAASQANLVNTLMAAKQQEQKMVDEVLAALNMPTRRELDTAHRRIHSLQRQVRELQESHTETAVRDLREEVAALMRTVESLRAHLEQPADGKRAGSRAPKSST